VAQIVPKDFKKTKTVDPALQEFLRSGQTFTVCLLTPKKYDLAGDIYAVRRALDQSLAMMRAWGDASSHRTIIKAFESLRQRAKSNNFDTRLVSTMIIATVLAAFCGIVLVQQREIEAVGWFPDRDSITTSYDRIAHSMFAVNFSAFCQRLSIEHRSVKTLIGIPNPDVRRPSQSWYDELVRIPDFLAGPLASWAYTQNLVPGRQKYVEVLSGAVADNPNVITLLLLDNEKGVGVYRLLCSKSPFPDGNAELR
jgi:hypothetical protein